MNVRFFSLGALLSVVLFSAYTTKSIFSSHWLPEQTGQQYLQNQLLLMWHTI